MCYFYVVVAIHVKLLLNLLHYSLFVVDPCSILSDLPKLLCLPYFE